jgi:arginase
MAPTRIIVVPYDSGRRDVRMGAGPRQLAPHIAKALRDAGHDVRIDEISADVESVRGELAITIDLLTSLAESVRDARANGEFPLVLAGNCNSSLGTVAGLGAELHNDLSVCWFDAHGDFNTPETSVSGFIDGMALAMLTGRCWSAITRRIPGFQPVAERQVTQVGVRHPDPAEISLLETSDIRRIAANSRTDEEIRAALAQAPAIYVHLDLDVLDESEGRANQYACGGGLTSAALLDALRGLASINRVQALALTAYDPAVDTDGRIRRIALEAVRTIAS